MDIVILFAIVVLNGHIQADYLPFKTVEACQAAIPKVTADSIAAGATDGSFVCTVHHVGKLA